MTGLIPTDVSVGGVYFPPALLVILLGLMVAVVAAMILNRTRLSRFFWHPPLVFMALWLLASAFIGLNLVAP